MNSIIKYLMQPDHVRLFKIAFPLALVVIVAAWFATGEFWWWAALFPFVVLGRYRIFLRDEEAQDAARKIKKPGK